MIDTTDKNSFKLAHLDTINRITFTSNGKYIVSAWKRHIAEMGKLAGIC
jgi:hypothetical protein